MSTTQTQTAATMITDSSTFDAAGIRYSKPKVNKSGGKNVGLLGGVTNKPIYLSTPLMLTWGVNTFEPDVAGQQPSYNMSLQFPKDDYTTPETLAFLESLRIMEAKIKDDAVTNSAIWFNKPKMSAEVIDALWTPMLKYPRISPDNAEPDLTRAPTLRLKIPYWDDKFNVELYDMNSVPLFPDDENPDISPLELIQKGQNVAVVIQSGGVWFANGKFGTTWKLVQAVVQPRASVLGTRMCHVPLNASARSALQAEAEASGDETDGETSGAVIADSDEETINAVQEEVQEEVSAAPKKKVVRKKKVAVKAGET